MFHSCRKIFPLGVFKNFLPDISLRQLFSEGIFNCALLTVFNSNFIIFLPVKGENSMSGHQRAAVLEKYLLKNLCNFFPPVGNKIFMETKKNVLQQQISRFIRTVCKVYDVSWENK